MITQFWFTDFTSEIFDQITFDPVQTIKVDQKGSRWIPSATLLNLWKQLKRNFRAMKIGIDYFPNEWKMLNSNSICNEFILTSQKI